MSSFVRYSIAVYVGLLMAGTAGNMWSRSTQGSSASLAVRQPINIELHHEPNCPKSAATPSADLYPCRCWLHGVED